MDLSQFKCTCKHGSLPTRAERLFADRYGIDPDEAHMLFDATEDVIDEALAIGW